MTMTIEAEGLATSKGRRTGRMHPREKLAPSLDVGSRFDLELVRHDLVRLGVGADEVRSAIEVHGEPPRHRNGKFLRRLYWGDLEVVVNDKTMDVISVADLDEALRTEPRRPLHQGDTLRRGVPLPAGSEKADPARWPETDEVQWLLRPHAKPDARFMNISPVIAHKLLTLNLGHNRSVSQISVADAANQMITGQWRVTHQGVALDRDGQLIDGQHRLGAIVASDTTQYMLVVVGLESETFSVIDTGRRRSLMQTMHAAGIPNASRMSSLVRGLWFYWRGGDRTGGNRFGLTPQAALEIYHRDPEGFQEAGRVGYAAYINVGGSATGLCLAAYLLRKHPRVGEFFEGITNGYELTPHDARYALRRYLRRAERPTITEALAITLKAWAAWLANRPVAVLSFRRDEEMPAIAGQADMPGGTYQ